MDITKENRMPLVEYIRDIFAGLNLERTLIIACQHILPTNLSMFLYLCEKGLKPKNVFILGKCYSTDKKALDLFVKKGFNISRFSQLFDSHKSYDTEYFRHVNSFLLGIIQNINFKKYDKIILVDDGGFLIKLANDILKNYDNVIGIEQTSSGYEKIKDLKIHFPIINVARSYAKLEHESKLIAEHFLNNLNYELKKLKKQPKKMLIIGRGPIGKEISNLLKKDFSIATYDSKIEKSNFVNLKQLRDKIKEFDVIIGCTGENSLPTWFYNSLKKEAILVSVSSSDREFAACNLRLLTDKYKKCHKNIKIRDIYLLNSGFPLTFSEYKIGLEAKKIQITRALIFSAIYLANSRKYPKGIVNLNDSIQKLIIRKFNCNQ